MGFEPTMSELSTVFTVEEGGGGVAPNYRECFTSPRALKGQMKIKRRQQINSDGDFSKCGV